MPVADFLYAEGSLKLNIPTQYSIEFSSPFNSNHKLVDISYPSIFKTNIEQQEKYSKYLNTWSNKFVESSSYHSSNCTGAFSGKVLQDGNPLPYSRVRLYCRENGKLIYQTITDKNGNWSIKNLDQSETENYYAISLDDNPGYNAIIWDKLTPQ